MKTEKVCPVCGKTFNATRASHIYCSAACYRKIWKPKPKDEQVQMIAGRPPSEFGVQKCGYKCLECPYPDCFLTSENKMSERGQRWCASNLAASRQA